MGHPAFPENGGVTATHNPPFNDGTMAIQFASSGLLHSTGPLDGTGDFSLGMWIKTTTSTGYLISQRDTQNNGQYVLQLSGGAACYWDYPSGTNTKLICTTVSLADGQWHHIGFSRTGRLLSIYVDGLLNNSTTTAAVNTVRTDNGLAIAYDQRDNARYTNMVARDLFIYSRALSADEFRWLGVNKLPFP